MSSPAAVTTTSPLPQPATPKATATNPAPSGAGSVEEATTQVEMELAELRQQVAGQGEEIRALRKALEPLKVRL